MQLLNNCHLLNDYYVFKTTNHCILNLNNSASILMCIRTKLILSLIFLNQSVQFDIHYKLLRLVVHNYVRYVM